VSFQDAVTGLTALDPEATADAAALQDRLAKPRGALGRLESLGIHLAGIAGACPPPIPEPVVVVVFAGDHGVLQEGVTPWPQEVTAQMVGAFCAGRAAINVFARQVGAEVVVVDVGVASDLAPAPGLLVRKVRHGTANLATGPAMTVDEARQALDTGASVAAEAVVGGARCLVTGDMGIGNTTPSAAIIAALTGRPPAEVTGRGTGIDDATHLHKIDIVEAGVPVTLLQAVGPTRPTRMATTARTATTMKRLSGTRRGRPAPIPSRSSPRSVASRSPPSPGSSWAAPPLACPSWSTV